MVKIKPKRSDKESVLCPSKAKRDLPILCLDPHYKRLENVTRRTFQRTKTYSESQKDNSQFWNHLTESSP